MITLWRIAVWGIRNFLRNAWLSTAATAVMTVTLILILTSYVSTTALNATIKSIVNKIDVSIFLKDDATADQTKNLQAQLQAQSEVQSVRYVSKSEALQRFLAQNQDRQQLNENLNESQNPLPASLEIKAKDPKKLDQIVALVAGDNVKPLVLKFSYEGDRKKTIDSIVKISNFLKSAGLVASLISIVISVLIIFNTIRMAIFARRAEIEIMKLVGATNWFVRGPFMFEAAMYGVIASVIAATLCVALISAGGPKLATYVGASDISSLLTGFARSSVMMFLAALVIGVSIGITSSLLAMSRYLKLD